MKKALIILCAVLVLMFAEYRYIMTHLQPYYCEDGFLYIEVFGQADTYYAEPLFVEE